jgi:F0F1-type ATP synthase membrane subunit a
MTLYLYFIALALIPARLVFPVWALYAAVPSSATVDGTSPRPAVSSLDTPPIVYGGLETLFAWLLAVWVLNMTGHGLLRLDALVLLACVLVSGMLTAVLVEGATTVVALFLVFGFDSLVAAVLLGALELVSWCARSVSLPFRLFANLVSGHLILHLLVGSVSVVLCTVGPGPAALMTASVVLAVMVLEVGLSLVQLYVFVSLLSVYRP